MRGGELLIIIKDKDEENEEPQIIIVKPEHQKAFQTFTIFLLIVASYLFFSLLVFMTSSLPIFPLIYRKFNV